MKKTLLAAVLAALSMSAMAGNCDHSYQSASDGSNCGGRSADSRPGGAYGPYGTTSSIYGSGSSSSHSGYYGSTHSDGIGQRITEVPVGPRLQDAGGDAGVDSENGI